jgi:hypothetical protein
VADVAEFTVTPVTFAPIPPASGILLKSLMAEVNELPFCSSATRCDSGVLALKNFSQFAVICAVAELPVEADEAGADEAGADEAGADEAGAEDAGADDAGADELDDEAELLQAATASTSAKPIAGARMIRRATSGNRIARP